MRIVFIALIAACGTSVRADSIAIPLVDPADPIQIASARVDLAAENGPRMLVELENRTPFSISTREIWLDTARFFTRTEMERAGNRKAWDCGWRGSAASDSPPVSILPGARVVVSFSLPECVHTPEHEHYFVELDRLGNMSSPSWKREPAEFARLLNASMPHK